MTIFPLVDSSMVIGDKNAGRGERVAARRFGDDFDWKGGHSANLEAPWVI